MMKFQVVVYKNDVHYLPCVHIDGKIWHAPRIDFHTQNKTYPVKTH